MEGRMRAVAACRTCGTEPLGNARFCHGCGTPVAGSETHAEYKQVTVALSLTWLKSPYDPPTARNGCGMVAHTTSTANWRLDVVVA